MGVQIVKDPKDRQFWVIGSARDINPVSMVREIERRCRPSSIKFVLITSVEALWLRMLVPLASSFFSRYLKPELAMVWIEQTNTIMSILKRMSPANQGDSWLAAVAKALGNISEREQTKLLKQVTVVTSLSDIPRGSDYTIQQMLELQAQMRMNSILQDAMSTVMKNFGEAISAAARN
jgi:hypothetical protein